jgi:superkiller protein 3
LGRVDEALKHFEEAVRLEPRNSELFTDFAIGLNRLQRFSEAEGKFRKALELDPLDEQAHGGLATALLAQGKRDGAIEEFTKTIEINPANSGAHNFLGRIFLEKGDRQKALAHWSDSLRLDPKQPEVLDAAAKILAGQGRAGEALERWESQLQLQPKNAQTMSRLALLKSNPQYPKLRNPAEALALAQQSCEITGYKDLECLYALAAALAASEKLQEASEIGTKALKLAEEKRDTALAANIRNLLEFCKRGVAGGQGNEGLAK